MRAVNCQILSLKTIKEFLFIFRQSRTQPKQKHENVKRRRSQVLGLSLSLGLSPARWRCAWTLAGAGLGRTGNNKNSQR